MNLNLLLYLFQETYAGSCASERNYDLLKFFILLYMKSSVADNILLYFKFLYPSYNNTVLCNIVSKDLLCIQS